MAAVSTPAHPAARGGGRTVRALLERHDAAALRAALVRAWARGARLPLAALARGRTTGPLVEGAAERDVVAASAALAAAGAAPRALKDVEAGFEALRDPAARRASGFVTTPAFVVAELVRTGLAFGRPGGGRVPLVCDPACGAGGFLLGAADVLCADLAFAPEHVLAESLVGVDRDPRCLEESRALAELWLLSRGVRLPGPPLRLVLADTLLADPAALLASLGAPRGFDLVATNPPYVKLQNLEPAYRAQLARAFAPLANGSFGTAPLFLLAGLRLLAPAGTLALVTQNNLFTSLAARAVRQEIRERRALRRIVDFGAHRLFPGASAYACLVFLGREPAPRFAYAAPSRPTPEALARAKFADLEHASLGARTWRLGAPRDLGDVAAIEAAGTPLGDLAAIRVGFATLKDSVFLVREEADGTCVATGPGGEHHEVEREATRPAVRVSDIGRRAEVEKSRLRVLFPYEREDGRWRPIPEERLRALFPAAFAHLARSRPLLAARDKGRRRYAAWYAWGRTQGMDAAGPKLLTRTFDRRPRFHLDPSDRLYCNGYGLFPRPAAPPVEALARILSSSVMAHYLRLTSFRIAGGFHCCQKNFLERFAVPALPARECAALVAADAADADARVAALYGLDPVALAQAATVRA